MIDKATPSPIGILIAVVLAGLFFTIGAAWAVKLASDTAIVFGLLLMFSGGLSLKKWPIRLDKHAMEDFSTIFEGYTIIALFLGSGMVCMKLYESWF